MKDATVYVDPIPASIRATLAAAEAQFAPARELWNRYGAMWQEAAGPMLEAQEALQLQAAGLYTGAGSEGLRATMAEIAESAKIQIDTSLFPEIYDAAGGLCSMAQDIVAVHGSAAGAALDGLLHQQDINGMMAGAFADGSRGLIGAAEAAMEVANGMEATRAFERVWPSEALDDFGLSEIGATTRLAEGLLDSAPWTALTPHADDLATLRESLATSFGPVVSAGDALGLGAMKHDVNGLKGVLDGLKLPTIDFPSFPLPTISDYPIAPPSSRAFDMPLSPSVYRDIEQTNALHATTEAIQEQNEILRQAFEEEHEARLAAEARAAEDHRLTLDALGEARRQRVAAERSLRLTQRTVAITIAGVVIALLTLLISTL